jgi:hypothetical protein
MYIPGPPTWVRRTAPHDRDDLKACLGGLFTGRSYVAHELRLQLLGA